MKGRPKPADRKGASGADAEAEAFHLAMARDKDVVRLSPDPRGRVRPGPQAALPDKAPRHPSSAGRIIEDGSEGDFAAPGVDRRELRKMKRGERVPGGRIDLHGQTAAEALASVTRFIAGSRHRCVCIVHGRGLHSAENGPVLKTQVRAFLRQHRAVLAYADAPRADGGAGAVYVLLRKRTVG